MPREKAVAAEETLVQKPYSMSGINVKDLWFFPLEDESAMPPTYGAGIKVGPAASVAIDEKSDSANHYGDGVVQDSNIAFGGGELTASVSGYTAKALAAVTGAKYTGGGSFRSGDDIAPDGALVWRRVMNDGGERLVVVYKGKLSLSKDEAKQKEDKISYTDPEFKGTFVDIPNVGWQWSVDTKDVNADPEVVKEWFNKPQFPDEIKAKSNDEQAN